MRNPFHIFLIFIIIFSPFSIAGQKVVAVENVSMTVDNMIRSVDFYTQVLDFQLEESYEWSPAISGPLFGFDSEAPTIKISKLSLGSESIQLMEFSESATQRPIPADSKSNDLWFQHIAIVVSDMDSAYEKVRKAGVTHVSTSPQTLPEYLPAASGITAFYFRDPDGHNLELIHFPMEKSNPKWKALSQTGTNKKTEFLFLGIDHTAIGIEQTETSYSFWRDILKMDVAGHSENYGTEQEHLNQVFGARLWITGLKAEDGFGVEFLDYIAPPGGRTYPADSQVSDLWHWHTTVRVTGLEELAENLQSHNFTFVSQNIVSINEITKALLVRDPDGHAVMLIEGITGTASGR